jgi:hypothetical protein
MVKEYDEKQRIRYYTTKLINYGLIIKNYDNEGHVIFQIKGK